MQYHGNTVHMSKTELQALLAFTSTDKIRPSVNAVWFHPLQGLVQATDGHRALRVRAEVQEPASIAEVGISRDDMVRLLKLGDAKSQFRVNTQAAKGEVWKGGDLQIAIPFELVRSFGLPFDELGFDKPLRTQGIPVWHVEGHRLEDLSLFWKGWSESTQHYSPRKAIQVETPEESTEFLRLTLGVPGESHCWQLFIATTRP